jgi:hypothetical protein
MKDEGGKTSEPERFEKQDEEYALEIIRIYASCQGERKLKC